MTKSIRNTFLSALSILAIIPCSAQTTLNDEQLAREGARIGRAYYSAQKNGDIDLQNDALNQFNEILITLRKQAQVDILTNAFNNVNVPISNPVQDTKRYTRAVMNAYASGDSIAIEDANDIALTVKKLYAGNSGNELSSQYAILFDNNLKCAQLGREYSNTSDFETRLSLKAESQNIIQAATDSLSANLHNETFDYYSITLTTPEEDAVTYSEYMKKATASGLQSQVDAVARIIGMVYERYSLERNESDAKLFNSRVNELLATEQK